MLRSETHKPSELEKLTGIIGTSPSIEAVQRRIIDISKMPNLGVLITGEPGSGKELVARAIHRLSHPEDQNSERFVVINSPALPENLADSELLGFFGFEPGYFGRFSMTNRLGRPASGNWGTLFFDEIGEMNITVQPKMLRLLDQKEILLDGQDPVKVRVIAATNRDLRHGVSTGKIWAEFFDRLNHLTLHIPTLRERREDIPKLVMLFIDKHKPAEMNLQGVDPKLVSILGNKYLAGNVRELENCIETSLSLAFINDPDARSGMILQPKHLLDFRFRAQIDNPNAAQNSQPSESGLTPLEEAEKAVIIKVLEGTKWNKRTASKTIGIGRQTLYNKMEKYGIPAEDPRLNL